MRTVISASRKTDVPTFYLPWFIEKINQGYVDIKNPRYPNAEPRRVSLAPKDVHSIVFWSKNYGPFLKLRGHFKDYELFFHYSITGCTELEPHVPDLETSLVYARELITIYGIERFYWRFDPIAHWLEGHRIRSNADRFLEIAARMKELGAQSCFFSFVQWYPKVQKRMHRLGIRYTELGEDQKHALISQLAEHAASCGITLLSCAQPQSFCAIANVREGHCINALQLTQATGKIADIALDRGQRAARPLCSCTRSVDIGEYFECPAGCVYCYAHPRIEFPKRL